MMKLFNLYRENGKITDAILIGKNLLNNNPGDTEIFSGYFELLCTLAQNLPSLEERKFYAGQAEIALAFYSENVKLNDVVIGEINRLYEKVNSIMMDIINAEREKADLDYAERVQNNESALNRLLEIKDRLYTSNNKDSFDHILQFIRDIDMVIDKDILTSEQNSLYEALTKEYTDIISGKMRELELKKNVEYNKKAVDSFDRAFKLFKNEESKYRNHTQLFSLVSSNLLAYDLARLFEETKIYYTHVYSYIFNKLDDDGKYALTRFSIESERK